MIRLLLLFLLAAQAVSCQGQPTPQVPASATVAAAETTARENPEEIARNILAPLLDPEKVATLKGDRPANARLYRILYWLETTRAAGGDAPRIIDEAQAAAGYANSPGAKADKQGILWSRAKLEEYGCFNVEGLEKLKKGGSPVITKGKHAGDNIALDHVLPRAVVPELAARFYNLEAIPSKENLKKSAKISKRELDLARRWRREGLLSEAGLKAIEEAGSPAPATAASNPAG